VLAPVKVSQPARLLSAQIGGIAASGSWNGLVERIATRAFYPAYAQGPISPTIRQTNEHGTWHMAWWEEAARSLMACTNVKLVSSRGRAEGVELFR
jgi:hypothetical protein